MLPKNQPKADVPSCRIRIVPTDGSHLVFLNPFLNWKLWLHI